LRPASNVPVESSAYFAIGEAIDDAIARGARAVVVDGAVENGRLVVRVEDDGAARTITLTAIADRIGAIGGDAVVDAGTCTMEFPCG
jgi:hypothetical protein